MEIHTFLIQLVVILFSARVFGELAAYFNAPSVIGEITAGILIGPSVLGLIGLTPPVELLAQIGIILLLFEVGVETDIGKLKASGTKALLVALCGVVLPFLFGFFISYSIFQLTMLASFLIGCTLTATSIGITLRVLRDLNKQNSHEAQIILGAAVLDDIIGIILLAVLYEFSQTGVVNLWTALRVFIFILLFFIISPIAAKIVSMEIKKWDEKSAIPGLLPTTIVSLILLFAWIAHLLGAPEILGGFAAGLALSRHFPLLSQQHAFSDKVEEQMRPIIHLFTPIFFVAIGLSLNFKAVDWTSSFIWMITGTLFVAAVIGKLLSGFVLKGEKWLTKMVVGTSMIPRGEVGLIFANVGLTSGIIKDELYAAVILVIALTTLLAPFALRYVYANKTN